MELRQPWHLMRRINSFLLVVGAGLIVSIGLALAARWLLELIGCSEANANVSALFLMPIIWTIVAFTLLMQTGRRRQLTLLLGAIVPGAPFLLTAISG